MAGIDRRFSAPKGVSDTLPAEAAITLGATKYFAEVASLYGYSPIETPVLERTEVFERSVGVTSDIVSKQMYTFEDKSGDSLTLRPEGTAGVVRAFVEHEIYKSEPLPWRVFYIADMFRYERPQAGRYRQFKQVGVEAIGAGAPEVDVEQIDMCLSFLGGIGVAQPKLLINSIGDPTCRPEYLKALVEYLDSSEIRSGLCADCRSRANRNPLRVLDCKRPECKKLTEEAPKALDYLCEACRAHFEEVIAGLEALGIDYRIEPRLVRGLDYYTRTAFEVVSGGLEAAQDAVAGGGRYDGLVELFGGPPMPAVGFAVGLARSLAASKSKGKAESDRQGHGRSRHRLGPPRFEPAPRRPDVFVIEIDAGARDQALRLASSMRALGVSVVVSPGDRSVKSSMKHADRSGASVVALLGPDEVAKGEVTVRALRRSAESGPQQLSIRIEDAPRAISEILLEDSAVEEEPEG